VKLDKVIEAVAAVVAPKHHHRVVVDRGHVAKAGPGGRPQGVHRLPLLHVQAQLVEVVHSAARTHTESVKFSFETLNDGKAKKKTLAGTLLRALAR